MPRPPPPDERRQHIGERVRARRSELRLTQDALAERTGLSKSFLSEVEGGRSDASGLNYLKLAQALEMDIKYLLTGEGAPEPTRAGPAPIPEIVSRLAEERDWSHRQVLELSEALGAVIARRTRNGQHWEPSPEFVAGLAEALQKDRGGDP
jgi:DNA-binding XRE family transcriptional regulator